MIGDKICDQFKNPHWPLMYTLCPAMKWVGDEEYLRLWYRFVFHRRLDLENPRKLTEKLQWLKLHDRNPLYTKLVDKYAVKSYVSSVIGKDHVIPCLGCWSSFDEIEFDKLPEKFILKTTHDSGGAVKCFDKKHFDCDKARIRLGKRLSTNFYWQGREWPYKNVPRKIIAEPLIESLGREDSVEYKLSCFNGEVKIITLCRGIAHDSLSKRTNDHYDKDLNRLDWYAYYRNSGKDYEIPAEIGSMITYAEQLSKGIPYVRVDFYLTDRILFGEMTFYTWGGLIKFSPSYWDDVMGDWLDISKVKR